MNAPKKQLSRILRRRVLKTRRRVLQDAREVAFITDAPRKDLVDVTLGNSQEISHPPAKAESFNGAKRLRDLGEETVDQISFGI
jgi:hypothetical protein